MTIAADIVRQDTLLSRMQSVFDRAPVAALVIDPSGRVEAANAAAARLLCYSVEALAGREFAELVQHGDHLVVASALEDGVCVAAPAIRRRRTSDRPGVIDDFGAASMLVGGLDDGSVVVQLLEPSAPDPGGATVAEQRAFRSALLELSELSHTHDDDADFYATLLERAVSVVPGAQAGSIVLKRPGTDEYYFVAAYGFDLVALQERCLYEREIITDSVTAEARINSDLESWASSAEQEEWLAAAGRVGEIAVNVSAPVFIAGEPVAFISLDNFDDPDAFSTTSVEMTTVIGRLIADLLRRRELEAEVRRERESYKQLALHDGLTGLANRRFIETSLTKVVTDSLPGHMEVAVFFLDIDDFKSVNDRYGHEAGDEVMVAVADALRRATRPTDVVGRWGGDEFMVIAPGVSRRRDVKAIAERILGLMDDDIVLADGRSVACHLSIGAAWCSSGWVETDELVRSADRALYEAKLDGKHTVRYIDC
ncbi:MAG: sensor domain-containing diguanylate cyclase [Ilumatobacter sp.]|uniref:GGDEF domain-containing protein n=1 Tax=Ilumatobacter sp. TaxID=1967498 RepID=UPI003C70FD9C